MSANVCCAGLPVETRGRETPTDYDVLPSCGWKGERFPSVEVLDMARVQSADQAFAERATAKPCPRCGGLVELIPERTP